MTDTNVPSPESTDKEDVQPKRVIDFLREYPGTLSDAYAAGAIAYDKVISEEESSGDTVSSDDHGETLRKTFAALGFDLADDNLGDQLQSIGVALETLITKVPPLALLTDPLGPIQNAYTIGLLSGVALSNKQ